RARRGAARNAYPPPALSIPAAHTFSLQERSQRTEPLYRYPGMFLASWHGVALGLAPRAIDATTSIVQNKLSVFPPPPIPLRQRPHARVPLAKAEMEWRAARAFPYDVIDQLWDAVQRGNDVSTDG